MTIQRGTSWAAALLLCLLSFVGCKKPSTAPPAPENGDQLSPARDGAGGAVMNTFASGHKLLDLTDLKQLVLLYKTEADSSPNGRGPANLEAWTSLKRDLPKVYQALKEGDLIFLYGVNPNIAPAGASNTVLGYVADVPTKGVPLYSLMAVLVEFSPMSSRP